MKRNSEKRREGGKIFHLLVFREQCNRTRRSRKYLGSECKAEDSDVSSTRGDGDLLEPLQGCMCRTFEVEQK